MRSSVGEALKSQGHFIVTKYFLKNADEHPNGKPLGVVVSSDLTLSRIT